MSTNYYPVLMYGVYFATYGDAKSYAVGRLLDYVEIAETDPKCEDWDEWLEHCGLLYENDAEGGCIIGVELADQLEGDFNNALIRAKNTAVEFFGNDPRLCLIHTCSSY